VKRREGLDKLTGREPYIDDVAFDDVLWGATVRSPAPRGRIREIRFGDTVAWDEVVVVDHRDLPGPNCVKLIEDDQPILAVEAVLHVHEPVVLLAHRSRDVLRRAVAAVEIVVDEEPAYFDFRRPPRPDEVQGDDENVLKRIQIEKGDVAAALAAAPIVVEGVYETGAQEHVYLETQGMVAWEEDGVVVVQGSMQCPYYVHAALMHGLSRGKDEVRVIQAATGGGFGGKEEYPSTLALHASLLALKAGRPVKIIYDRGEDMAVTTKRHPSQVRHRTGVDAEGRLLAQEVEVTLDAGAYHTLSTVVLSRAVIHAGGPYACDHVLITGCTRRTNMPPSGAFRGFGAPQTHFANERHMDRIAERLGMDPAELRRRNLLKDGETTATSQRIDDGADRQAILERALQLSRWDETRREHEAWNGEHPYLRRGIGLATFHHGAGFTGAGEGRLNSLVEVVGGADGKVKVLASSTEMGQGTTTIFAQIAAARLGYDPDDIVIARPDTREVPDSGPTVASRTVMVVGRLVEKACDDLCHLLNLPETLRGSAVKEAIVAWHHDATEGEELRGHGRYVAPPGIEWDDQLYRGDAYGTFGWGTYVADVEVDLRTWTARVRDFVAVQDVGNIVNETLARGQVQGGVVQGIGWALCEDCRYDNGAMVNNQLTNYIIPTSDDVPPIRVDFLQTPYAYGAMGAKGLGELPMDGPAPAIANAVAAALGVEARTIPLTPERIMDEMAGHKDGGP
jgi:CO/xanthine dehydrogenase Mo-binding subunit